jgi:hypothetical protein
MTEGPLFSSPDAITVAFRALHDDLLAEGGPRISTMRNHRFAIVPYAPSQEFALRQATMRLSLDLQHRGWRVRDLSLQRLVLERIAALPEEERGAIIDRERRLHARDPARSLQHLKDRLVPKLEGTEGLARGVAAEIDALVREHPDEQDRSVVFLSRAGALYPFTRASALLKHLAGRTHHVSVVLLYPGERRDDGLSFLGELQADRDYRPRIYP